MGKIALFGLLLVLPGLVAMEDQDNLSTPAFKNATGTGPFDIISADWPHNGNFCSEKSLLQLSPAANGRDRFIVAGVSFSSSEWVLIVEMFDGYTFTGMVSGSYDRVITSNVKIENVRIASLGGERFDLTWTLYGPYGPHLYEISWNGISYTPFGLPNYQLSRDISAGISVVQFGDVAVNPTTGEPGVAWTDGRVVYHRFIKSDGTPYCAGTCGPIYNGSGLNQIYTVEIGYGSGGRAHVLWSGRTVTGHTARLERIWYHGGSPGWSGSFTAIDQLPNFTTTMATEMLGSNVYAFSEEPAYPNPITWFTRQTSTGFAGMNPAVASEALGSNTKFPSLALDSDGRPYASYYNLNNTELEVRRYNWNGWGYAAGSPGQVTHDGLTKWWMSLKCDTFKRPTLSYTICNSASQTCADSDVRYTALQ